MLPARLRRVQSGPATRGKLFAALGFSLLFHLLLALTLSLLPNSEPLTSQKVARQKPMRLRLLQPDPPPKEDQESSKLFMPMTPPEREWTPDKARIVDAFAESHEKQMRRKARPGAPGSKPSSSYAPSSRAPNPESAAPRDNAPDRSPNPEERDQKSAPEQPTIEERHQRPEIITPEAWERELARRAANKADDDHLASGDGGEKPNPRVDPSALFPSAPTPPGERGEGGVPDFDFLRDLPEGERNLLNRKRTRYWAFFERVQSETRKHWSPAVQKAYKSRDPYGNVYGVKDRLTTLRVSLRSSGALKKIFLARSSGLDFYDKVAIQAIKKAAPFPNPPEGLKDEDGYIHFNFHFFFDIRTGELRWLRPRAPK